MSVAEIYAGVRKGEEIQISKLFILMEYLKTYAKSHGVELGDALIAACSTSESLPLWMLNKKHYPMKEVRFYTPIVA